jgi:hypothetical protein
MNGRMGGKGFLVIFIGVVLGINSVAIAELETANVLPKGVISPRFIFGSYSGLTEKYNSTGSIEGITDQYHINLNGKALSRLGGPKMKKLVESLNSLPGGQQIGDDLSAGTLDLQAKPTVQYFVPEIDYGVTPNLSIGIAIPIVHFHNSIQVSASGNTQAVSQFAHGLSPELDQGLKEMVGAASNLGASINQVLSSQGYRPLADEDFTAPGDLLISGVWRYYTTYHWRLALRPYIQVPTGRQDDPNDLEDVATGGQPALGLYSIHELQLEKHWSLVSSVGYQLNIPDNTTMRVPEDGSDAFPGMDRLETVHRVTGNTVFVEAGVRWFPWHPLEIRLLYDFSDKAQDWYQGDHADWNYSLLGQDTGSQIQQFRGLIEFSSLDYYLRKTFSMPFLFGYVYGNVIYAVNAPNEISNQLYLRMFF